LRPLRDASASSVARASAEGRDWRGQAMEEIMAHWTVGELMHLTRDELCDLSQRIELSLIELEAGSVARSNALASIVNISRVMQLRGWSF